ncbi:MAG TPA: YggS family pyridoxal phosphate-dependent enzyme [Anaerolineae bacterium]|nr:YggS family pyridoxal phosphate-dependent enzyme [Anaerolineae bacterium]
MIEKAVEQLLKDIPEYVTVVAAAKTRTVAEVEAAFRAGIRHFGHNYVQEAQAMISQVNFKANWHMIGHLQRNKVNAALHLFNLIETVDSIRLVKEIEKRAAQQEKTIPVLIEINSGREENKSGVLPEQVDELVQAVSAFEHLHLEGLMTMGPRFGDPEESRPYFIETRRIFERLENLNLPNVQMRYLSMGMSNSYRVAIDEGANVIRVGTLIFGSRD